MPTPLLPNTQALPVWDIAGHRTLESSRRPDGPAGLMQLAGTCVARLARAVAPHARQVWVMTGPGNNGGDGLEAARHLHLCGLRVQVVMLARPQQLPSDALGAWQRAIAAGVHLLQGLPQHMPPLDSEDLCIDALLGIGATRPPQDEFLQAIDWMNSTAARVLSIDVPSGLDANNGQALGSANSVVRADHTLSLLAAKPGLFMGVGRDVCGHLWLDTLHAPAHPEPLPQAWLNSAPPGRAKPHASHKGSHGDVAVVGGEHLGQRSMTGAAVLAATAALHCGAGRVFLSLLGPAASGVTWPADIMVCEWQRLAWEPLSVVAGCGGGQTIREVLPELLQRSARLVLDADGLNALAGDPWLQDLLRSRQRRAQTTVLTPHPLEAARLLDWSTEQVQHQRLKAATTLAQRMGCTVVLKGSGTVIAAPEKTPVINPTGNGRLATGGTGDVLAGLLGALLARGSTGWSAACEAVWWHGQAADDWPQEQVLTASRLAERLVL